MPTDKTNLKQVLREECLPALTKQAAYFSTESVAAWLRHRKLRCPPATLNRYLHEFRRTDLIHDAGRGWYSIRRVERLGTAVSDAMNAIEHGNQGRAEIPVEVEVATSGGELVVRIRDVGEGPNATDVEQPDIEAKLAGLQKPRGWGLFLIENMVDEIRVLDADGRHTVELVLRLEGGDGE